MEEYYGLSISLLGLKASSGPELCSQEYENPVHSCSPHRKTLEKERPSRSFFYNSLSFHIYVEYTVYAY